MVGHLRQRWGVDEEMVVGPLSAVRLTISWGGVGRSRASALERPSAAATTAERGTPLRVRSLRESPHDVSCHSVPCGVASVGAMATAVVSAA
jgi:hypothetical protein